MIEVVAHNSVIVISEPELVVNGLIPFSGVAHNPAGSCEPFSLARISIVDGVEHEFHARGNAQFLEVRKRYFLMVCSLRFSSCAIWPGNYVLFLGRMSAEKGGHLLVGAFEQIETDVKLVLAGASSYCDDYSRKLRQHANDRIRILDWVSGETLDELLTNAMILVLPSDLEGLPMALLDAMGAGL